MSQLSRDQAREKIRSTKGDTPLSYASSFIVKLENKEI